jgi:hypothetical protein
MKIPLLGQCTPRLRTVHANFGEVVFDIHVSFAFYGVLLGDLGSVKLVQFIMIAIDYLLL